MSVREHADNTGPHNVIVQQATRGVLGTDGQDINPSRSSRRSGEIRITRADV
ncbi:hypothetical protein [Streptomyces guryensis]|uniref:Uncharacterized protein n=1 Tax=Streptomyces guryensis TaxID=2886947 RepID=A0A9Q3VQ68_9ACTN|nr:hypothetical protein [Streptomyces guryensis]MCD9875060.1 hypothetical protein [Streptomyces guryensis]